MPPAPLLVPNTPPRPHARPGSIPGSGRGLTALRCMAHPEITTSCNRRRTGQIADFSRLRPEFRATTLAFRNKAPCQSSHPGKLRFTSRDKGMADDFRRTTNKGGRLHAVVAAGACQPYPLAVGGFGSLIQRFGATAMASSHHGLITPGIRPCAAVIPFKRPPAIPASTPFRLVDIRADLARLIQTIPTDRHDDPSWRWLDPLNRALHYLEIAQEAILEARRGQP